MSGIIVAGFSCPLAPKDNLQTGSYVICCTTSGVTDNSSFVTNPLLTNPQYRAARLFVDLYQRLID